MKKHIANIDFPSSLPNFSSEFQQAPCNGQTPCNNCVERKRKSKDKNWVCYYDPSYKRQKNDVCPDHLLINKRPEPRPAPPKVKEPEQTRGRFSSVEDLHAQLKSFTLTRIGARWYRGYDIPPREYERREPVILANFNGPLQFFLNEERQILQRFKTSGRAMEAALAQNFKTCLELGDWFGDKLLHYPGVEANPDSSVEDDVEDDVPRSERMDRDYQDDDNPEPEEASSGEESKDEGEEDTDEDFAEDSDAEAEALAEVVVNGDAEFIPYEEDDEDGDNEEGDEGAGAQVSFS